jgi:hypothetical protein
LASKAQLNQFILEFGILSRCVCNRGEDEAYRMPNQVAHLRQETEIHFCKVAFELTISSLINAPKRENVKPGRPRSDSVDAYPAIQVCLFGKMTAVRHHLVLDLKGDGFAQKAFDASRKSNACRSPISRLIVNV